MLRNYLKIALRNLLRHKGYSFINIFGLAAGLACCMLIALYVLDELSYDRFYEKADRLFRLATDTREGDHLESDAGSPVPLGPALKNEFPEITEVVRFWQAFRPVIRYQDKVFREELFYFTDIPVFAAFSFELLQGDSRTALASPQTVVLTETTAKKYFGEEDPIGKVLSYKGFPAGELDLTVTGIMRDLPHNTHIDFDFLASIEGVTTEKDNWGSTKPIWTYVLLPPRHPPAQLESKLPVFVNRYFSSGYALSSNYTKTLHLEPITGIHLYSRFEGGFKPKSDIAYVYLFSAIGFFILLIGCINFMNLATARSLTRAKEIGMRKMFGAYRPQLIKQFLSEAILLSSLALLLAAVLVETLLPLLKNLSGKSLNLVYFGSGYTLFVLIGAALLVGILAGSYPAFFLSGFQPLAVLKGSFSTGARGARIRKGLVVFQFIISTVLIVGTVVVYRQLEFVRNKKLGITQDQIVVMPYSPAAEPMTTALLQNARVKKVSVSQRVPVNTINDDTRPVRPEGAETSHSMHSYVIDEEFLATYDIPLVAGRMLYKNFPEGETPFLLNETAVRQLGWRSNEEALGKRIRWSGTYKSGLIVGVVRDFHLTSLHEEIAPLVLTTIPEDQWWRTFISVRLDVSSPNRIEPADLGGTLKFLETTWRKFTPDGAFEYFFIDDSFEQLHRADKRMGELIGYLATIAILIAGLGLFGLAAFTAQQRTKEIGIRKVLGASVAGIIGLLSKDFLKLVFVANLFAWPIAYYAMNQWLQGFAYRINLGWWVFALASGLALLIALLTVSTQAIRAALANPVEALRYE